MNDATLDFIRLHADDDVRQLALRAPRDGSVDVPFALNQIAGRQTARRKLPSWAAVEGILFPPHLNMEQCSSEQTARYKATVVGTGGKMADLTGGFGVDCSFISRGFNECFYVEQSQSLCELARHNLPLLGLRQATVVNTSAEDFLNTCPQLDFVFIDPARRDAHGARTYSLADCSPDVLSLMPLLVLKARRIMMKLSPMLDWRKAVADVEHAAQGQAFVCGVHIVSVANECKELLLDVRCSLNDGEKQPLRVACANLDSADETVVFESFDSPSPITYHPSSITQHPSPLYLYEPNASIMKAGCFGALAAVYDVQAIAPNSHLFVSAHFIGNFPGRKFRVNHLATMNKRDLRETLAGITHANISVRNFPLTADQLRKRLRLKDGGTDFIFATTDAECRHILLICSGC